ncbi:phosphate ABC transporter substrate-binding protein [Bifidobacterium animalis subsp. animalis ATCC 27672]|nr:phosphate ABC transporter substrate-binding protein [Bifidobacterium animalis subsp. animalis ATCC 27672]
MVGYNGIVTKGNHMRSNLARRVLAALCGMAFIATTTACGDNTDPANRPVANASSISGSFAGAGASSQQTAVEAWVAGYQKTNPDARISYNPSGSGAGVATFLTGATVWAASDKPLDAKQVKESTSVCAGESAFDVPVYISPLAIVFNLQGVSDAGKHINMDAATIAKVFDGRITRWNDAALTAQNPGLSLPDLPITVVHRSDKSGTTLNFLEYIKAAAPADWPYELSENWPNDVGQGAKGTSGVISTIDQANGTIGYADFSQAGGMGTVAVQVGDTPTVISAEAASKAVADSTLDKSAPGKHRVVLDINHTTRVTGAYPIVLVSYDIACPAYRNENTARFAKSWLDYITSEEGQRQAMNATGSAPLPANIAKYVRESIDAMEVK